MNKAYKKTAPNTAQAQIEFHIEDFDAPAIGNAKTALIISAIIYILSNYTSEDNPRSVIDIHKIISGALGSDDATSENTVRRFVNGLCLATNTNKYFRGKDYSCKILRKQLGGRVVRAGSKTEAVYYFQRDYDGRDIDIVRSFVDDERNGNSISGGLKRQDKEYVRMLCDMYAPRRESTLEAGDLKTLFEKNGDKLFRHIGDVERPGDNSFFTIYHMIDEAIKSSKPLTIYSKNAPVDPLKGDNGECVLIPERLIWNDNKLYVEGKSYDTHDKKKIRIADIIEMNKTK